VNDGDELGAYAQRLWHKQVWDVAVKILYGNREAFNHLVEHLHQHHRVQGGKLNKLLAEVKKVAP
jgi:hypothetical protein